MTPEEQKAAIEKAAGRRPSSFPPTRTATSRNRPDGFASGADHGAERSSRAAYHDILKLLHEKTDELRKSHGAFSTFDLKAARSSSMR
jgi:hypothetical protein